MLFRSHILALTIVLGSLVPGACGLSSSGPALPDHEPSIEEIEEFPAEQSRQLRFELDREEELYLEMRGGPGRDGRSSRNVVSPQDLADSVATGIRPEEVELALAKVGERNRRYGSELNFFEEMQERVREIETVQIAQWQNADREATLTDIPLSGRGADLSPGSDSFGVALSPGSASPPAVEDHRVLFHLEKGTSFKTDAPPAGGASLDYFSIRNGYIPGWKQNQSVSFFASPIPGTVFSTGHLSVVIHSRDQIPTSIHSVNHFVALRFFRDFALKPGPCASGSPLSTFQPENTGEAT